MPEDNITDLEWAIAHAEKGGTVVFVDDVVGSGDQFISTWEDERGERSFASVRQDVPFTAAYVCLAATNFGLESIGRAAPTVAVSAAHVLTDKDTLSGLPPLPGMSAADSTEAVEGLLLKYSKRLKPHDDYIANNEAYRTYGYKNRRLLLGFEHSMPDATLPIFWSAGTNGWIPLRERK